MSNNLWNRIQEATREATRSKKYLYVPLEQGKALQSGRSYLRIMIAEMFLEKSFEWFKTWYPAVSVGVQLSFGDQPATIVSRVAKPPQDATQDGVLHNYRILPLTPFNGGTVEVQAALLAMQGDDYLGTALDVLQDFSSLVGPPLGQVLTVAEKVSNGLNSIMNATGGKVRLPYQDTFVGRAMGANELRPGYLAIIGAEADKVARERLSIVDGKLFYDESSGAGPAPFRQADYVLLRIDGPSSRDDYMQLSSIATPYEDLLKALGEFDLEAAATAQRLLQLAVFRCEDLVRFDRPRVWDAISKEISGFKSEFGLELPGAEVVRESPYLTLNEIMATRAVPMEEAAYLEGMDPFLKY